MLHALALLAALAAPAPLRTIDEGASRQTAWWTGDPALDGLQDLLAPTLAANEKAFTASTGTVRAFGAGEIYPQVWLRDSATVLPLARWLYGREHLTSWIEEHFAQQDAEGGLFDWIAAGPVSHFAPWAPQAREVLRRGGLVVSADKNTVEADQESSAVLALGQVARLTGDVGWLRRPVAGVPLLERADRALRFVLDRRFDPARGLATSGFSADWGDVSPVYPDQRAIYLDAQTPVVVGLYTNALLFGALTALADLHDIAGDGRAAEWRTRAEALRAALDRELWQERSGFYRVHLPVAGPPPAAADDSGILALGGHAVAAGQGVLDARRLARVLGEAERRMARLGVPTLSATLLPPYARGVFKHPAVAEEYAYQNGGQWDWFGGRLVQALFAYGQADAARAHLQRIAARAVAKSGLHEWWTRSGEGKGSGRYAGAAGVLAGAVVEGLFGVNLGAGALEVTVRCGASPAAIHLYEPATGTFVAYRWEWDARERAGRLRYASSHARPGRLALRVPDGVRVAAILRDGHPLAYTTRTVGRDRYVTMDTDWHPHDLELLTR